MGAAANLQVVSGDDAAHGVADQMHFLQAVGLAQFIDPLGQSFGKNFHVLPRRQGDGMYSRKSPAAQTKLEPQPAGGGLKQAVQQNNRLLLLGGDLFFTVEPAERLQ